MMSKSYTYTFIIPHKNCPDLLQRCINSIPERDDVQIIVVDDNSDEDKKPTVKRENVEIILLDANHSKGAGRARNEGLKQAKGKWLLFADSDDYYNEGFLDVLDNYHDTNYDVIYFNFIYKDGNSYLELPALKWSKIYTDYDGSEETRDRIRFCNKVPWTKMTRTTYISNYNIKFEEVPNGNDILFSLMVGNYTDNFGVVKTPIYVYLRNENSILTKKLTMEDALCRLIHRIKLNGYYELIGYSRWKSSVLKLILHYTWVLGIPFLFRVLFQSRKLYSHRKDWAFLLSRN